MNADLNAKLALRLAEYGPDRELAELLELTTQAGRRCAYDLDHACSPWLSDELRTALSWRARNWLLVFMPVTGPKDYRHRLHHEIIALEHRVENLRNFCKQNGFDPNEIDTPDIPF